MKPETVYLPNGTPDRISKCHKLASILRKIYTHFRVTELLDHFGITLQKLE